MQNTISLPAVSSKTGTILFDFLVLSAIYILPAISHLIAFPVYYFDPMRIALILTLFHTNKRNAFLISLTLPLFSFLISTHPSLIKSGLIASELTINVLLFFYLLRRTHSNVISLIFSVIISKAVYYTLKFISIESGAISGNLVSTPFYYQTITLLVLSLYVLILEFHKKKSSQV